MSADTPDAGVDVDWPGVLDASDTSPSAGQVGAALSGATELGEAEAFDRVERAIEAGELVESDEGGAFPLVHLPATDGGCNGGDGE